MEIDGHPASGKVTIFWKLAAIPRYKLRTNI